MRAMLTTLVLGLLLAPPGAVTVLTGATLIDGTGAAPVPNATVVVAN